MVVRVRQKQASAKSKSDKKASVRDYELGVEPIFVENLIKQGQPKWLPGTKIEKMGSACVQVGKQI